MGWLLLCPLAQGQLAGAVEPPVFSANRPAQPDGWVLIPASHAARATRFDSVLDGNTTVLR